MGRLQFWLQGHPDKWRPWAVIRIGNWISDGRYYWWRLRGGRRLDHGGASLPLPDRPESNQEREQC